MPSLARRADRDVRRLPLRLQRLSHALHLRGWRRAARIVAWINRVAFSAVLAPEAVLPDDLALLHGALGVVIHPLVTVGTGCIIQHHVTLGTDTPLVSGDRMIIGNDVRIGAHAILLGSIAIGDGALIGAGAVVTRDIPPGGIVVGTQMRVLEPTATDGSSPS
jgi:serine O-acetyltransferase